jgi:Ca2+-binding EF-hand superfamily protein
LREGISPLVAFKSADVDRSGIITTNELEAAIKKLLPEEAFSVIELRKIQ